MVTRQEAIDAGASWGRAEFHRGQCIDVIGPRGGKTETREVWRVNGACKTWKREPERFQLPVKYGFRGPYGYITEQNAAEFHAADMCVPVERNPYGFRTGL